MATTATATTVTTLKRPRGLSASRDPADHEMITLLRSYPRAAQLSLSHSATSLGPRVAVDRRGEGHRHDMPGLAGPSDHCGFQLLCEPDFAERPECRRRYAKQETPMSCPTFATDQSELDRLPLGWIATTDAKPVSEKYTVSIVDPVRPVPPPVPGRSQWCARQSKTF